MDVETLEAKYDVNRFEWAEIEGEPEKVSAEQYALQFVAYLVHNKLFEARFLWQRVPAALKTSNPELESLFGVCRSCVNNDAPRALALIDENKWPQNLQQAVQDAKVSLKFRLLQRVCKAYTCLHLSELAALTGCSNAEETMNLARTQNWRVDEASGLVWPKGERQLGKRDPVPSEDRLNRITDFISFLEK